LPPRDVEDLDRTAEDGPELGVGAEVVRGARESQEDAVAARRGVDALRVRLGHVPQDLELCPDKPVGLRMRPADGAAGAFGLRRFANLLLPELDDLREQLVETWVERLDARGVANEIGRHVSALLDV